MPVLDTGARGATTTFVERGIGDVLVAWENDALLTLDAEARKFQIVVPASASRPSRRWRWWRNVDRHGTRKRQKPTCASCIRPEGVAPGRGHFYRPAEPDRAGGLARFPGVKWVTIDGAFGGWKRRRPTHFADGGLFDRIMQGARASADADRMHARCAGPPTVAGLRLQPRAGPGLAGRGGPAAAARWRARGRDSAFDGWLRVLRDERVQAAVKLSFGASFSRRLWSLVAARWWRGCWCATVFPGRRLLDALVDLPFACRPPVAGIALTGDLAANGWLGRWLARWA